MATQTSFFSAFAGWNSVTTKYNENICLLFLKITHLGTQYDESFHTYSVVSSLLTDVHILLRIKGLFWFSWLPSSFYRHNLCKAGEGSRAAKYYYWEFNSFLEYKSLFGKESLLCCMLHSFLENNPKSDYSKSRHYCSANFKLPFYSLSNFTPKRLSD